MRRHPFRFGVQLHSAPTRAEWIRAARRAEDLGYDVVSIPDHVGAQLAPFAALAAAAEATQRIDVGTLVLDNDFRHPLLTAHEAATVHLLSDGRLELGLGAGWLRRDYERLGIEFATPVTRVERLEEAVEIVALYLRGDPFSFSGSHYAVTDAEPLRLPPETAPPRVLVGGGGPRVLALAARRADVASVFFTARREGSSFEAFDVEGYRRKLERVPAGVEVNVLVQALEVTNDRRGAVERWAKEFETTPDDFMALPFGLVGTVDQIVEDLERHREGFGASYFTVRDPEAFAPVVAELGGR